jgi:DNA-binding NarL/FixJ family response regulator
MAASDKITILLADEDALRRDGLAAVLKNSTQFEVVGQCPDGVAAMEEIRNLRPQVAVVDLNLPKVHGIELVRRVRGETLSTKVLILAGTDDEDVIREVVRAGADGYLLKNGPARHVIDALSYICDGGQYFSPQLGRDGRNRHLLEEPARIVKPESTQSENVQPERRVLRTRRAIGRETPRRTSDPHRLRERLREDAGTGNLEERDYEILSLMADGIKPILDRLDEIEGRIDEMETGNAPVPSNVESWLSGELEETLQGPRGGTRGFASARTVSELEARLPRLIEQAVSSRFRNMAGRLQQEIEETHIRALETFVQNIQTKLVQRVFALENDMERHAEAVNQLRQYSQRTEDNLGRLIRGVEKLTKDLPKSLPAPSSPLAPIAEKTVRAEAAKSSGFSWKWGLLAVVLVVAIAFGGQKLWNARHPRSVVAAGSSSRRVALAPGADAKARLKTAAQYADQKDYAAAEGIYKDVLKGDPGNVEALKSLASVLYREDKIEESTAVLDRVPRN